MKTKKMIVVLLGVLLLSSSALMAQNGDDGKLGVDLDSTFVTKYVWRGFDVLDDHGAWQPSVNLDLFGTGFSANVWGSIPIGSGGDNNNIKQEYDYTLAYGFTLCEDEAYAMNIGTNYIYYDFPKVNSRKIPDMQELGASIAMPKLMAIGELALVPSYYYGQAWAAKSDSADVEGAFHLFTLSCDIPLTCPITDNEFVLTTFGDLMYNDGALGADHDWSHSTVGVSTAMEVGPVTVSPAIYYQISMEDTVNENDELYGGLSVSYSF